jgi:hypothetical protein
MKSRSRRIDCAMVLVACHKLGQGDRVCNLHEISKNVGQGDRVYNLHEINNNVSVGEGQGQTNVFTNFLCIWTDKVQVLFILYLPQITTSTKPLYVWHALPRT